MIQYRESFFETNSSSTHALIVPMDQDYNITSVASGDGLDWLLEHAYGTNSLISWLYSEGVTDIRYNGESSDIRRRVTELKYNYEKDDNLCVRLNDTYLSKKILALIIFGEETRIDIVDDHGARLDDDELVFLGYEHF